MKIKKSYITDEKGIKNMVIDLKTFKKLKS